MPPSPALAGFFSSDALVIPIITYGSESWEPKKKEIAQIETIFNKALKTILQLPDQTPTAILLAETGFLTIEMNVNKKKIMHTNRVLTKEEPALIQQLTQGNSIWRAEIRKLQEECSITDETLQGNKETLKKNVYSITLAMPRALIQVCCTPLCMVQRTHLITTGGTPHLYNRGSSMLVNSLHSGENNM